MRPSVAPPAKPCSGKLDAATTAAIRRLVQGRRKAVSHVEPLRVWVPRFGEGLDAYSVAFALIEEYGARWREAHLTVIFTAADADDLSAARAARYPAGAAAGMTKARFDRFFAREDGCIRVRAAVRSICRFMPHLPVQVPPFSRIDLIVARETLAPLTPAARQAALRAFHAALAPGGALLDPSEAAAHAPRLFAPGGAGLYAPLSVSGKRVRKVPVRDGRLRESEDRFRVLFSRSDMAILVRDAESGVILQANEAAAGLYGWTESELTGMRVQDLIVAPEAVRRPGRERRAESRLTLPHCRRKDGTVFPADATSSFMMLGGRPCDLWAVRDATPRLTRDGGRGRTERDAASLGDIVHELRTPIAVIQGSAETLRKGVRGGRARKSFLGFIESHALRMAKLVDRLLDIGTADSPKALPVAAPVALAETVRTIAASFLPIAKRRGIALKIDIPEELSVLVDAADLPHVFGNLLDNALKFTPRGGKVFISGRAEGGEGLLFVRDTGAGIPVEDLTKVFERFYRSGRTRGTKGTGLGLAIVAGIVKANHGRVFAENDPAGGAVFCVALPLAPGAPL